MVTELIPVVDLRFLSQSELTTLALSSPNAFDLRRCDDVVVPKIDRSVFNESAGSRKQTYSRLRLAPPKSDSPSHPTSLPRRRGRPRSIPLHTAAAATPSASVPPASDDISKDPDRRENLLIASFLRQLFSREDASSQALTLNKAVSNVCVNESNDGWKNILDAAEEAQKALVLAEDRDRETLNSKGVAVDLVALGQMEDPFGEELRRRTLGLKTEVQLFGFLSCVEGQWGSRRKRRRFVDASLFGDVLPRSWKLLLGLKRKDGSSWLDCRRYVSPNGHHFASCKEVSLYLLSLQGAMPPISDQDDNNTPHFDKVSHGSNAGQIHQSFISNGSSSFSSLTPVSHISGNQEKQPEGTTCYYATPISYISCDNGKQQLSSSQRRRAKRRRLGKALVDGVILKDGKFVCQFCHKAFSERHRYNGHIGAHVRYQGLTADVLVNESSAGKITDHSSWAVVPYTSSDKDISAMKIDGSHTVECVTQLNSPRATTRGQAEISNAEFADGGPLKGITEEGIATEIKCNDRADSAFPSASDLNSAPQDFSPMITEEASPSNPVGCAMISNISSGIQDGKSFEKERFSTSSDAVPLFSTHPRVDTRKGTDTASFSSAISMPFDVSPVPTHLNGGALCNLSNEIDLHSSVNKCKDAAGSPDLANLDSAACNADEVLNSLPSGKTFDGISLAALDADNLIRETVNDRGLLYSPSKAEVLEKGDCNSINYTAHNSVNTSDYMDADTNTCYGLSLSLMDMDVKARDMHNGISHPPGNLTSEFENYNDKLLVEIENHSFALSGNQPSNDCVMYTDISTHAVEEHLEKPKSRAGQDASEYLHQLFDKDNVLENSSTFTSFGSEQTRDIGANTDCPFGADINECVLQEIDKPINELEFFFGGTNSMHEGNGADETIENDAENKAVHISLSNSSWLQSTNVLPVLGMLPDQCGGGVGRKSEHLRAFEGLRLGSIEPSDFALFTGQDSRAAAEPSISLGYTSELEDQHCSSFQLGWSISLGSLDSTSNFTSVCVWCSREFRHENADGEPHSETLGFICPSCKAKFSS